jgi:hypothetical protein
MVVGGQRNTTAVSPPGKTRHPLYRSLGGPQGRPGHIRKISSPRTRFDPRTAQPITSVFTDYTMPARNKNNSPIIKGIDRLFP